jgi:RimJ/RimL family protein N-acetyltransferase
MKHWPLFDLRLRTPRLELRLPTTDELGELAELAVDGVHDPKFMPFLNEWTDQPPVERGRSVMQYHWRMLAAWSPENWSLNLVVRHDGTAIGTQEIFGKNFAVLKEFGSGSWLGRRYHGNGFGTEMRAAILHFGFAGLGGDCAVSGAFDDNAPSLGVSRKLGYKSDGTGRLVRRGRAAGFTRLRLPRSDWARREDIAIEGLENCREMFG